MDRRIATLAGAEVEVDIPFVIPGTTDPAITVRRSAFGSLSVLVNGTPVKPRRSMKYDIPLGDGTVTELRLTGQWTGLKAEVNGVATPLEPPVSRFLVALTFLPLLLGFLGGAIGAAIGVLAAGVNLGISRGPMRGPAKVSAMLGTTVLAAVVTFGIAFVVAPLPNIAIGNCLNSGARDAGADANLDPASLRPVACATAHENEVVGLVTYTGDGAYPGVQALTDFAMLPCVEAFEPYVGISWEASTMGMFALTPSDQTWIKGDRRIACIVASPDGSMLTGSVRGTAR